MSRLDVKGCRLVSAERPASIPPGLVVELSRARVKPGAEQEADRWMRMLNDRLEECVATLERERMAIEIVFRMSEDGREYLYWLSVKGEGGAGLDPELPIDRDHIEQAERTKEPGWVAAEPQVLMLPAPVREAVLAWALGDREDAAAARDRPDRAPTPPSI